MMIKNGVNFKYELIDNKDYYSLGTPEQVNIFEKVVCFDLDGTLVYTDDLYTEIWHDILIKYDIHIDKKFFNNNIKGLSDAVFLKSLLPNITQETIQEISVIKDELFVKNIDRIVLFEGALEFIRGLQNCRLAIVTNCNKKSAIEVLKTFKLDKFIKILISADDCNKTKPYPEPYILAIEKLNARYSYDNNKCIVFEDSFTGYKSALQAKINKIFIKLNDNTEHNVKMLNCKKFNNYSDLNIKTLLSDNELIDIIKESFNLPVYDIVDSEKNIKGGSGGYICNIYSYQLTLHNNIKKCIVLKVSNNENILADTAHKLNLYVNEMVFYEKISSKIDVINIPKCYGVYNNNKIGILLEDLFVYNGSFNINLNRNINLLLNVIDNISKLHLKYYYTRLDDIEQVIIKNIKKINEIQYYSTLIKDRFDLFKSKIKILTTERMLNIMENVYINYDKILNLLSSFPLNICHGDLKSPNIFYKNDIEPYFLDWQYVNLSKGVTDIVFLLVESINFNIITTTIVINYYYKLIQNHNPFYTYESYLFELKLAFCCFPFFVTVWFNSEDSNILCDKTFPLKFMKNMIKYYEYFIDEEFIHKINNI